MIVIGLTQYYRYDKKIDEEHKSIISKSIKL